MFEIELKEELVKDCISFIRLFYKEFENTKDEELEEYIKLASLDICEIKYTPKNYIRALSLYALHLLYQANERKLDNTAIPAKNIKSEKINDINIAYEDLKRVGQDKEFPQDVYHFEYLKIKQCFVKGSFNAVKEFENDERSFFSSTDLGDFKRD